MLDATASLLSLTLSQYVFDSTLTERGGMTTSGPYGAYACSDGYFVVAVGVSQWERFCQALDRPALYTDPSLRTGTDRARRRQYLKEIIEEWARDKTKDQVVEILIRAGIPAGPVREVGDLLSCPHLTARGMILQVDDPVAGRMPVMGFPIKLSEAPPPGSAPPPQFGQHGDEILAKDLGLSAAEIQRLREAGVIG